MIYVEFQPVTPEKALVVFQMFQPEKLSEERMMGGLLLESLPEMDESKGIPTLYINPSTKALWYEYTPMPAAPIYPYTEVGGLQKQIDDLKLLVAQLITGGTE